MERINLIKRVLKIIAIALTAISVLMLVLFIVHVFSVNKYNATQRVITDASTITEVVVDIHPRGQITDSWEKENTGMDYPLNAKIYEFSVTNNSGTLMDDWSLRINPGDDCYLNNGWCGSFEVHQIGTDSEEKSQLIDLRNYDIKNIKLDFVLAGQDLLIPLRPGDYMIYRPDGSEVAGEVPIKSSADLSGIVTCGLILYSKSGEVELSSYELYYRLHKSYFEGKTGLFFMIGFPVLGLFILILAIVFFMYVRFEEKYFYLDKILSDVMKISSGLSDSKDFYSKQHSERVAKYAEMIAEKLGMDKSDCEKVYYVACLHNIGNYFIPEQILRKPGKLTSQEYEQVKSHTKKGADFVKELKNIPYLYEGALYHHERYDGTGYPLGKKGDEIPLIARIIAVADAYDAMSTDRPYRQKLMREQIREEFIKNRGTQFDPMIVSEFLEIMGEMDL